MNEILYKNNIDLLMYIRCVVEGLDSDDVVGLYGEDVCSSNGSKLVELMQQLDLVLWNCR